MTTTMTPTVDDRFEEQVRGLEVEVASVCGVLNAAAGRLVELLADAMEDELWNGWGIHSPAHWLGWQAGMSRSRADGLVKLAGRRAELPSAVAALVAGELSVDAAVAIARRAPAAYEASITEQAKVLTIGQLGKVLAGYHYDDETQKARPKPRDDERSVSSGVDDIGWWGTIRLPARGGPGRRAGVEGRPGGPLRG